MPTRSPGAPAGTIATLDLPTRAVTALTRAGITDVVALAGLSRRELAAVPGLGPGLVTAIRRVVPEPPAQLPLPSEDDGGPASPEIPSFASLRDPRRRTAFDLLVPEAQVEAPAEALLATGEDAGAAGAPEDDADPGDDEPEPAPASPRATTPRATAPRPAEYADLLAFGVRVARSAVTLPARLAVWSVRTQADLLRRLLG
ncbi:DNA-directed RNA polymerase subunit alpha C-terminal domain-containing protein [Geodermatophilus sp. FMUSA9-8]|uniref:DNA-directed RNA polymerase subunit alpha C-terminal domain-containing protein n=1 Tax=Geodermatophilus sp. FMUSA9-8 TaxID=3120155 RepID=UPI0030094B37